MSVAGGACTAFPEIGARWATGSPESVTQDVEDAGLAHGPAWIGNRIVNVVGPRSAGGS